MDSKFSGIFPALLTPFDSRDKVNKTALSQLIHLNLKAGVAGFYVCGSTAEVFLLSPDERREVYETVAAEAGNKATLIAHVGAIATKDAIEYGKYVKSLGYDAISAISPFYYKFTFEQIKRHYFSIADAVGLPMIVYNFPGFSGVNLSVEEISLFLSQPEFIGVKHSSSDYYVVQQIKTAFPDKVVYNGYDEMFLCGLSMGADGGVGSTYNFMADKFIRMRRMFLDGDIKGAQAEQECVNRIITSLKKVGVMEGQKEVLCQLGIDFGSARPPFSQLGEKERRIIADEIIPLL